MPRPAKTSRKTSTKPQQFDPYDDPFATDIGVEDEPAKVAPAEPGENRKLIEYAGRTPWKSSHDNPMSMNFIPPVERKGANAEARWWALQSLRRDPRPTHGVFD